MFNFLKSKNLNPNINKHRQVTLSNGVQVDEGLSELIPLLWERGYETQFSCQSMREWGFKRYAQVVFSDVNDAIEVGSKLVLNTTLWRNTKATEITVHPVPFIDLNSETPQIEPGKVRGVLLFPTNEIQTLVEILRK